MNLKQYQDLAFRTEKMPTHVRGYELFKFRLMHHALGLAGELGELDESMCDTKEEGGDMMWYVAGFANSINYVLGSAPILVPKEKTLTTAVGELVDFVKRIVIYDKLYDEDNARNVVEMVMQKIFSHVCQNEAVDFQLMLEDNIAKLRKRYPEKYTNEAALARADKTESPSYLLAGGEVRDLTAEK